MKLSWPREALVCAEDQRAVVLSTFGRRVIASRPPRVMGLDEMSDELRRAALAELPRVIGTNSASPAGRDRADMLGLIVRPHLGKDEGWWSPSGRPEGAGGSIDPRSRNLLTRLLM